MLSCVMGMRGWRGSKDANHGAIEMAFRRLGCEVLDISGSCGGADLLVGSPHRPADMPALFLVEIKTPKGRVREEQKTFADQWRGYGGVAVVRNTDDVVRVATGKG